MKKNSEILWRLDKVLATSGLGSRKEIKRLLHAGRVSLGTEIQHDPARKLALADLERLCVDGVAAAIALNFVLMFNKPAGFLTARRDNYAPCIQELLPPIWQNRELFPCGRLDKDSQGLLVLTNDGQLCHRLCSPNYEIEKEYWVRYEGSALTELEVNRFAAGLVLPEDGLLKPAFLEPLPNYTARVIIKEGKHRQIRRMFSQLGREVSSLLRLREGPLTLDTNLAEAALRPLNSQEITALYGAVKLEIPELILSQQ